MALSSSKLFIMVSRIVIIVSLQVKQQKEEMRGIIVWLSVKRACIDPRVVIINITTSREG